MQIFKQHRAFFLYYFTFFLLSAYLIIVYSKSSIHLYFNQFHSPFSDQFFKYFTHLGDGWTIAIISILFLLFKSKRAGMLIAFSGILNGVLSQGMKRLVFGDTPRPYKYFTEINPYNLHYVEGVDMNMVNSLPSGHTSSAFAMCFAIALIYRSRKMDTAMFIFASALGVSRIYLSQHFLEDVLLGSIIGILSAIIIYSWVYSPKNVANQKLSEPLIKKRIK